MKLVEINPNTILAVDLSPWTQVSVVPGLACVAAFGAAIRMLRVFRRTEGEFVRTRNSDLPGTVQNDFVGARPQGFWIKAADLISLAAAFICAERLRATVDESFQVTA